MKKYLTLGFAFVRKNPTVIFSLLLIAAVTGVIVFNTFYTLSQMEASINRLLRSKALLAEEVAAVFIGDAFDDRDFVQRKIDDIRSLDGEVRRLSVLVPAEKGTGFKVTLSTDRELVDSLENDRLSFHNVVAWQQRETAATIQNDASGRFWSVVKPIEREGEPVALLSMELSLDEYDHLIKQAIRRVYGVALVSIIFVLLLVANHARLFQYAVRATHLEEIDRMKDDFISMASHELKTPLSAIRGHADLVRDELQRQTDISPDAIRWLDNIDVSAARLAELVNDILEVSRIEQGRLPVTPQSMDVKDAATKLAEELRSSAENKGLAITCDNVAVPNVMADPARVKQVLVNLLSNAVKYTPKGEVTVKFKENKNFVSVTVADTGLGISAEQLTHLFEKFYRVKTEKTASIAGTGLGLWISREIARAMGGELTVESIEGVGSHFTLKLKKAS